MRYKIQPKPFDKEGEKYSKTVYEVIGLDGLKIRTRSMKNHVVYKPVNEYKTVQATATNAPIENNQKARRINFNSLSKRRLSLSKPRAP